jgi:hypothetical protein
MIDQMQGQALLDDPIRSKGTAFTSMSAANAGWKGCYRARVETLDRTRPVPRR